MQEYNNPSKDTWAKICQRPLQDTCVITPKVQAILEMVKTQKDQALFSLTKQIDKVELDQIQVSDQQIAQAKEKVSQAFKDAIDVAYDNIYIFHKAQLIQQPVIETTPGVKCFRKQVGIGKVGLYIPGGSAALFSTLLMLGIPAKLAGCSSISVCTPCQKDQSVSPEVLYVASLLGIDKIYKVGGAQAIAALAYGTQSIERVDKIFGPGNQWVTKAKELVQSDGVAIDMPAGPSEVLVIATKDSDADFIASDLLSQCEHGVDSQVVLLSTSLEKIAQVKQAIETQCEDLPRAAIAKEALENSFCVYFSTLAQCIEFSNVYAPEHLVLSFDNACDYVGQIQNAGSVFLGKYACESAGDYASGTNHTLPTSGYARGYSGLSVDSFSKQITFQSISQQGIENLGPTIEVLAQSEGLLAHKMAVSIRLKKIQDEK